MAERPIPPQPLLLVDLPYAHIPRVAWPVLIARARRSGANSVVLSLDWYQRMLIPIERELDDLVALVQLCDQLGFAVIVSASPTVGVESIPEERCRSLAHGLAPLEHPHGPIIALFDRPTSYPAARDHTIRSSASRLSSLDTLALIYIDDRLASFRTDGSAPVGIWPVRTNLLLLAAAQLAALVATPVAAQSPDDPAAWADGPNVDIAVRHGPDQTIIMVDNRRAESYIGMLTYRARGGELLHLQVNIGPGRSGCVLLDGEELSGVALGGDASEGTWVVRAMQTSIVFSGGAGGIVPCGSGMLLLASQSGRFQLRRPLGWADLCAFRLTQHGVFIDAVAQLDGAHLMLPYVAEDAAGQTDLYALIPADGLLPERLCQYLCTHCAARAATMQLVAEVVQDARFAAAAEVLKHTARAAHTSWTVEAYRAAWSAADQACIAFLATRPTTADPTGAMELNAGIAALAEWLPSADL